MYVACQLQMECFPSSEQRLSLLINLRNFALRTIVEVKLSWPRPNQLKRPALPLALNENYFALNCHFPLKNELFNPLTAQKDG